MENLITVKCPECGHSASREEWNKATRKDFGDDEYDEYLLTGIFEGKWETCLFTCPSCEKITKGRSFL